jgi:superfamily II DNA or RNA helicase
MGEYEFKAIFGTTSLLAVGFDLPALDTLIITGDIKSSVLTTQSAGRILRLFAGKPTPKILDLWDNKNQIFSRQFYERKKVYESKKWLIKM